jgi:DNA-directed RNA polymerase subunit K/omega
MSRKAPVKSEEIEAVEEDIPVKLNATDSLYRGVIVACLRAKQLIKGATPRTSTEFSHKRKSTIVAVEELKQGLIFFEELPEEAV